MYFLNYFIINLYNNLEMDELEKIVKKDPWSSGSEEVLKHGLELLKSDTDTNRRLAMINIDNAVEIMLKTYLGLPKRETGLSISKNEFDEISSSFPKLLNAFQQKASEKIGGINLSYVEWFHGLRNDLYHRGNGMTIERNKVLMYAEIAKNLFNRLFGFPVEVPPGQSDELIQNFFAAIKTLDIEIFMYKTMLIDEKGVEPNEDDVVEFLYKKDIVPKSELDENNALMEIKNQIIRGEPDNKEMLNESLIKRFLTLADKVGGWVDEYAAQTGNVAEF